MPRNAADCLCDRDIFLCSDCGSPGSEQDSQRAGSNEVGAYDPVKNLIVWILVTGQGQTHMLAFTPDGKTFVSTNRGSDSVTVFELKGTDPLFPGAWKGTMVPACQGPEGLDISPDGSEAWVGCRGAKGGTIVNPAQKKVAGSFATNRVLWHE